MAYDNTNSGFIGKNNRKEDDKHPDITGSLNVDGVEYWLSGWKNAKGYGLRVKPKDESRAPAATRAAPKPHGGTPGGVGDMDDDIPF